MKKQEKKVKEIDPWMFAGHLLDQGNRIHTIEKVLAQLSGGVSQLVTDVNKASYELAGRVQTLEGRIAELERLQALKGESKKESGSSKDEDPDFSVQH